MSKPLTKTYLKKILRPKSYWLATSGGAIEDIVFCVPNKPIQVDVHWGYKDKRTFHLTSESGIRSCCPFAKTTKSDPVILFLTDVLVELSREKFRMLCNLYSHEDPSVP